MEKKLLLIVSFTILASAQPGECGQVLHETIQSKVQQSDVIVTAKVQNVKRGNTLDKPPRQEWLAICSIQQVLKGEISGHQISVAFLLPPKGIKITPGPHSLDKGKTYILFLMHNGNLYRLITPYHGDIEIQREYAVFDEDLKDDQETLKRATSSINGVPCVMLSHDAVIKKIKTLVSKENEAMRRNMTVPRELPSEEKSERWSEVVNGLQGRLVIKNKPNKYNETDLLDIILELKNVSTKPIAIQNNRDAISFRLHDSRGYAIPQAGCDRSGPVPYPQWASIPRDSYLGFSLYDCTVGIPGGGGTFIALPNDVWLLKEGEFTLHATFTVKGTGKDRADNAWSGELVLPPLRILVGDGSSVRYGLTLDLLWINPPENYTGTWTLWDRNGQKRYEINYIDGRYHGTFTTYHSNGQKNTEQEYKNHKGHGLGRGWYSNGQKMYEINYKDDKRHGTWTHWYENGQKQSEANYKDGEDDGTYTTWYRNGQKNLEINYKDGKRHGLEASWDEHGNVNYMRYYENGEILPRGSEK
jgi:antitoxin component YwqK of YwqJK toxin-antitoxin module